MSDGLSIVDLSELPAAWRTVMRIIMRVPGMTYADLASALSSLSDEQRVERHDLNPILDGLCREGYLLVQYHDSGRIYRANVARKSHKMLNNAIWNALGVDTEIDLAPRRKPRRAVQTDLLERVDPDDRTRIGGPHATVTVPAAAEPPPKRRTSLWDVLASDDEAETGAR